MSINIEIEAEKYSRDPDALVALVDCVINRSDLTIDYSGFKDKQAQLVEIAQFIEKLKKLSIPVPDELRILKLNLLEEIESMSQSIEELGKTVARLGELVARFESSYSNKPSKKGRIKSKSTLPRTSTNVLKGEIVEALRVLGGKGRAKEVMDIINERMKDRFLPGDFEKKADGKIIWKASVSWARIELKSEGILRSDSRKGEWELSEDHK